MTTPSAVLTIVGVDKNLSDGQRSCRIALPKLHLSPRQRVALVGESGSGKSTILSILALASPPRNVGRFYLGGENVGDLWARGRERMLTQLRARAIAYVPQRDGLIEFLSVRENLRCSARLAGVREEGDFDEILSSLNLQGLVNAHPAHLSGGQRQRVAVACALVRKPLLILADEPTASLDPENAEQVMRVLIGFAERIGSGVVLATHQMSLLPQYGFDVIRARVSRKSGINSDTVFESGTV